MTIAEQYEQMVDLMQKGQAYDLLREHEEHRYQFGGELSGWINELYDVVVRPLSKGTAGRYGHAVKKFNAYCATLEMPALPTLPVVVAAYLHDEVLAKGGSFDDYRLVCRAIKYGHARIGLGNPCDHHLVHAVLAAARKQPTREEIH
jgi:hypothetical protein